MKKLDRERITCPACGKVELRPLKDGDKVLTYICAPGCKEKFDPAYIPDFNKERVLFLLRQRNPAYDAGLKDMVWTADSLEQLLRDAERDAEKSEQYLKTHVVGWRDFDGTEWLAWPPPAGI